MNSEENTWRKKQELKTSSWCRNGDSPAHTSQDWYPTVQEEEEEAEGEEEESNSKFWTLIFELYLNEHRKQLQSAVLCSNTYADSLAWQLNISYIFHYFP